VFVRGVAAVGRRVVVVTVATIEMGAPVEVALVLVRMLPRKMVHVRVDMQGRGLVVVVLRERSRAWRQGNGLRGAVLAVLRVVDRVGRWGRRRL